MSWDEPATGVSFNEAKNSWVRILSWRLTSKLCDTAWKNHTTASIFLAHVPICTPHEAVMFQKRGTVFAVITPYTSMTIRVGKGWQKPFLPMVLTGLNQLAETPSGRKCQKLAETYWYLLRHRFTLRKYFVLIPRFCINFVSCCSTWTACEYFHKREWENPMHFVTLPDWAFGND